jgi:intracellular sulfur oxidation DsrE/DsrF family protein
VERKTFFAAAATAAAVAAAGCAKSSAGELQLVELASDFNYAAFAKLVDKPSDVRQVWDCNGYHPLILGSIKNAYNAYQFGFGIQADRVAMAIALHGDATGFAFSDAMWTKYNIGSALGYKDPRGNVIPSNVFFHARSQAATMSDPNDPHGPYQDATIEALRRRGLVVFVCNDAIADQAVAFVRGGVAPNGMSPEDVRRELGANLIPGAIVVPSGVATIGLLQSRYHYGYATVGA